MITAEMEILIFCTPLFNAIGNYQCTYKVSNEEADDIFLKGSSNIKVTTAKEDNTKHYTSPNSLSNPNKLQRKRRTLKKVYEH